MSGDDDTTAYIQNKVQVDKTMASVDKLKKIPRTVFFTGPFNPEDVVKNNRDYVPRGTEFRYYSDEQMDASARRISRQLAVEGITGAYEAFSNLRPAAFRADLWRAMVVWEHGGIYLDAKMVMTEKLAEWLSPAETDLILCWDSDGEFYDNRLVAAPPQDAKLQAIIGHIVNNVKCHKTFVGDPEKDYQVLNITGPLAYTTALRQAGEDAQVLCNSESSEGTTDTNWLYDRIAVLPGDDTIVLVDSADVHSGMKGDSTSYQSFFYHNQTYCDQPCPDPGACKKAIDLLQLQGPDLEENAHYWSRTV